MFGLSAGHLLILAVIVLIFGSRKLPELGSSLGKGLRNFKSAMEGDGLQDKLTGKSSEQLEQKGETHKTS